MGVAAVPCHRPLLLGWQPWSVRAWLLLLALAAGALLPSHAAAHPLGKTLRRQRAAVKPRGPIRMRHSESAAQLTKGKVDGRCTVNPKLVLFPDAPCQELAIRTRTANQCYQECRNDNFCVFYTFISTPYLDEPNCHFFATFNSGPHQCNTTDFMRPDPDWRTIASGSWNGGECKEDVKVPTKGFPFPDECVINPPVALAPDSPCLLDVYTHTSVGDCFYSCYFNPDCQYFTFYTSTPKGSANCYHFKQEACDETNLFAPDPSWGTMVYSSYYATTCPDLVHEGVSPHLAGAPATHFDLGRELGTSYCLVKDKSQQAMALLVGRRVDYGALQPSLAKGAPPRIQELEVIWRDSRGREHALHLVASPGEAKEHDMGLLAAAGLDGHQLVRRKSPGPIFSSRGLNFTFADSTTREGTETEVYHLSIPSRVDMALELQLPFLPSQLRSERLGHFNIVLNKPEGKLVNCRRLPLQTAYLAARHAARPMLAS